MRIMLFILSLLIFSCEELWDPIIEGCTTSTSCNFNPEAKVDDNTCIDPLGCDNWCPGDTTGVKELDCAGLCGGLMFIDCTGQCGILVIDECGVCGGNNTICKDCNGVVNGEAELDNCLDCVGGDTGLEACNYDCFAIWGGNAELDICGVCGGSNTEISQCNTICPIGLELGCDNTCYPPGTQPINDECNVCEGDNSVCAGCDGIPNSGLEIDLCGVCGGDGNCLGVDCTTDNLSGYCQDLDVLQDFIDNSSSTINMEMDENGNGVIEPLELGSQTWAYGRLINFSCEWFISNEIISCELSGEIPESIDNLDDLTVLDLRRNQLSGSIPSEIGDLTNLFFLDLFSNNLTGEIPSEIGNLVNLHSLWLGDNQLIGEIPLEIGNLEKLNILDLFENQLTGEIPNEICDLDLQWNTKTFFKLNGNDLCPPYPSCIKHYVKEQNISECGVCDEGYDWIEPPISWKTNSYVGIVEGENDFVLNCFYQNDLDVLQKFIDYGAHYMMDTNFDGNIEPLEWGYQSWWNGRITGISWDNGGVWGQIPESIGNLKYLEYLDLWTSTSPPPYLFGNIPESIGNLSNLYSLQLGGNQFSGQIPESICNLVENNCSIGVHDNNLCPPYPECIVDYVGEQNISECTEPITDINGNAYQTIQIGEQLWMAENLKVTHYNNGDEITHIINNNDWGSYDEGQYGIYDNVPSNADIYGNLYNMAVVNDERGICPEGFHVPSDEQWKELEVFLGMCEESVGVENSWMANNGCIDNTGRRGTDVGSQLAGNADLWNDGILTNNYEFGTSGFNAIPSGYRYGSDGTFFGDGIAIHFWLISELNSTTALRRSLGWNQSDVGRYTDDSRLGFSVRCIHDCAGAWVKVIDGLGDGDDICNYYGYTKMTKNRNCFGESMIYDTSTYPYDMQDCSHINNSNSNFVIIDEVFCKGCNE